MKGTAGFVLVFAKVKRVKFLKGLETFFCHGLDVSNKIKKIPDSRRGCVLSFSCWTKVQWNGRLLLGIDLAIGLLKALDIFSECFVQTLGVFGSQDDA